jgi:hypothetical protein
MRGIQNLSKNACNVFDLIAIEYLRAQPFFPMRYQLKHPLVLRKVPVESERNNHTGSSLASRDFLHVGRIQNDERAPWLGTGGIELKKD